MWLLVAPRAAKVLMVMRASDRAGSSSPPHPETVWSEDLSRRRQLLNLAVALLEGALSPFMTRAAPRTTDLHGTT